LFNHIGPTGTIHFEETVQEIEDAFLEAWGGRPSSRPVVEMTLPTSLDSTLAPPGKHVATLFGEQRPPHTHLYLQASAELVLWLYG
jgi:phytoene dehydrogenase-like protein